MPLTIGTGLIGHTGATKQAEAVLTPHTVPTGALAGRAVLIAPGERPHCALLAAPKLGSAGSGAEEVESSKSETSCL